jgi:hypothetical protein
MDTSNIVEKHGLTALLNHVLSEDFAPRRDYIQNLDAKYVPLRSGYDLADGIRAGIHVEGSSKSFRGLGDGEDAVLREIFDEVVRGEGVESEALEARMYGELLNTHMLGEERSVSGGKKARETAIDAENTKKAHAQKQNEADEKGRDETRKPQGPKKKIKLTLKKS